jgi:putative phosphoesterase
MGLEGGVWRPWRPSVQRTLVAVRLAVISDTHLPRGARRLPDACVARLRDADLILHAGDFVSAAFLAELEALGPPVAGVHGNVDEQALRDRLPEQRMVDAQGVRIGMVHDSGPGSGRLERLRRAFPACDAVVFGHSHIPLHETAPDGFQILNPGSPTDRRRQPRHTMAEAEVSDGTVAFRIVPLD